MTKGESCVIYNFGDPLTYNSIYLPDPFIETGLSFPKIINSLT